MACRYQYQGNWYTEDQLREVYNKLGGSTIPSKASPGTMKKIREFLDRIGVEVESLSKIIYNGKTLGINGLADPLNGLIQVVKGKEDITLPEEAMHMAVELIEQKDPKLFKEMMDRIGNYNLTNQVMREYQNNPFYQTKEGKPDVRKIKKEAIGKVLAQTVIDKNANAVENPTLLDQVRDWWNRIVESLKRFFLKAEFDPFEEAATQVLSRKNKGIFSSSESPFAQRNQNVVGATLKLVSSLRDPKAMKWFDSLYKKGQQEIFFNKLQQDLQAPKAQVDMLRKWIKNNNPQSIGDLITGVMAELSYTVEVNVATVNLDNNDNRNYNNFTTNGETYNHEFIIFEKTRETDEDSGMDEYTKDGESISRIDYDKAYKKYREENAEIVPSQAYKDLNVPGGVNYTNSEIKTPDITPSTKGHAAFSTDQGIGWFRSDDQVNNGKVERTEEEGDEYGGYYPATMRTVGGNITKTRRILEIQSDLFQKGRNDSNLAMVQSVDSEDIKDITKEQYDAISAREEFLPKTYGEDGDEIDDMYRKRVGFWYYFKFHDGSYRAVKSAGDEKENDFLQLLNKENNWVTFFVKAIIQDSAKKGYENVRFPGGNTANKIEGQQTLDEYISYREKRIAENEQKIKEIEGEPQVLPFDDDQPTYYITKEQREQIKPLQREIDTFRRELEEARAGKTKFEIIAKFYENTVQNILKKQGYKPEEVTDEHGNKWFEIKLEEKRDLGDFYFQISGEDLADKIATKNENITKKGDEFEINGNKIKNSVTNEVYNFLKQRIGAATADKALKGYKQETENKVGVDIQDILSRYIGDDNKLRIDPLQQTNPSAVDPYDNSFYSTLESHLKDRLNSYEPGTKFLHGVNLYNGTNTAGKADLIAITPQGQVDLFQFKVPQLSRGASDIQVFRQEAYNFELEQLRKILQQGYGVSRADFRQTRAIPIKADYEQVAPGISDMKLSKLTVGNINVDLIQDNLLLPIASESEVIGSDKFDRFIRRLKGLAQKLSNERVPPEQRAERAQRVAQLVSAIRALQIKKDGTGVLASASTIIKRAKERSKTLEEKISNTNPDVATIAELNKISEEILSDKDQLEVYKDLYSTFKNVFKDGTADSQEMIKDAREVSDDANDLIDNYWEMATNFRIRKFFAKIGITDEFNPEKKLTWYRRMIRSLGQSSIKAGAGLWKLVERINNKFKIEFLDRLKELGSIEKDVQEWMKGKSVQDLYKKIFQYDDKGRWNGRVIQKIDRQFYKDLAKAQADHDEKWVKANIDTVEYMKWYTEEHQRRIDDSKVARYSADDAQNSQLVYQKLKDFTDTFDIRFKKGINTYNWALANFPKEDQWTSEAYREIEKEPALKKLYDYYVTRLRESWDLGMIHEHNGWSWFPNVRRNLLEKLSTAPAGGKMKSLFGSFRLEAEDQTFGKIDPINGKPVDEIHANYVSDLFKVVQDADGNYFRDYSEKSMDIFKVLALWDAEILKYRLRTESEGIARLLYYTEADPRRKAYESTTTGKLKRDKLTNAPIETTNEVNADYIKQQMDAAYYGKGKSNEFDIEYTLGGQKLSGIKTIEAMNRYFVSKTLGLNVMTSIAQLFGGSINTYINQGLYFNKADMLEAEGELAAGKFWKDDKSKKLAGLISYIHPFLEDKTSTKIRKLSVSKAVEYLSSDWLFTLQRGADAWVNSIVAIAMFKNTMVSDGKLVNIRDFARKELGHANKYENGYESMKEFDKNLEKRVKELQNSPQALLNYAKIENDQIVLDGIDHTSDTVIRLRQQILEMIKDALGNTSTEDLSLYKRSIMWQSFFMFKNWIPRMADVRFGSLKYAPGTDKYEYGRMRMLVNGVRNLGIKGTASLLLKLGNDPKPLIEVAKEQYEKKKAEFAEEQQELGMTEAEFVDMYIKGVRSEVKELLLAAGLMAILISMRINSPDKDDDPEVKGAYRWALRGLDKLTDELTFMYTPSSATSILNGSVFPAVGILVEFERFFVSVVKKIFWNVMGEPEKAENQKILKHVFRALPVTKELMTYLTIFKADLAKDLGIRLNTNYGSVR